MGTQVNSVTRYNRHDLKTTAQDALRVVSPASTPQRTYQIRCGDRIFKGADIRGLIKLAVAARRK